MSLLFETIRILDGEPQNLTLHDERMNRSRRALFGCSDALQIANFLSVPPGARTGTVRCRVVYGEPVVSVEFSPYVPAAIRTLRLVDAGGLDYSHKFLDRTPLTALVAKADADDILIVKDGCVMDASFANIVFTDGRRWVTPDTPLLQGTMRTFLLQRGVITEERITVQDLPRFTHFRLINAMLGFEAPVLPVVVLRPLIA
jgi:4-amino-4-deoxychorismate lyase